MLGSHVANLTNVLAQMEAGLGVPIPAVSQARQSLEHAKASTSPEELERGLEAVYSDINEIAGGAQAAPNSLLATLLAMIEQHKAMRAEIVAGRQVAWIRELVSIDGVVHEVVTGAWKIDVTQPAVASPPKSAKPRRANATRAKRV